MATSSLRLFGIGIIVIVVALSALWFFKFRGPAQEPIVTSEGQPALASDTDTAQTDEISQEATKILRAIELFQSLPALQTDIFQDEKFKNLIDTSVVIDPPRTPARRKLEFVAPTAPGKKK